MARRIKVLQLGLGPIGTRVTQDLVERGAFEIVGAIDTDPGKAGLDLGRLAGLPGPLGVRITDDAELVLDRTVADVAILTTTSSLREAKPRIMEVVSHGLNVVSTCEELAYPWLTRPALAREIDAAAQYHRVAVLGTGVNPGFLMDFLPLALSGVCQRVDKVRVERIQDAQFRRIPFQKKIGAGLTVEQFDARVSEGSLRHVGLTESMHMIASTLGWQLDSTEELIEPVVAEQRLQTSELNVEPGQVLGVSQVGYGYAHGQRVIALVFRAALGEPESYERILIHGKPEIDMTIKGGVHGDIATSAIVVNAIPAVMRARPGLRTMADMELISHFSGVT